MERPQQEEIARSERSDVDHEGRSVSQRAKSQPDTRGPTGPVPEENRPGHHPEVEQDKPDR